jgi:DNA-binding protein H-NS
MSTLIDIQKQIAALQAQEAEIKAREFNEKVVMIKETMDSYGITLQDIQGKSAKAPRAIGAKSANPAPAKYRGPNGESWSGRGLAPKWLTALIAGGHEKDEYLINK